MKLSTLCLVGGILTGANGFAIISTSSPATRSALNMADNRRSFLAGAAAVLVSASVPAFAMEEEDYSNDFIQTLKARSDAKRNDADGGKVAWKKISNTQKFSQQYERPSFVGVQRKDLTFQMVTPEQLEELKSEGKVIDEYDVKIDKKGKESIDYKKGLIPKFVD